MAGLAELLLGKSNPFSQFISENQNKVSAAFGGLGSGTNFSEGLSRAAQGAALASPLDQAAAEKRQLANDSITARNKTAAYLRSQPGGAQFADAIENGMIDGSTAFKSWLDASKGPDPTASMRDFQFAQANPGYAEFLNPPSAAAANVPSGYRVTANGYEAIPGGPADPNNPLNAKKTASGDLSATETRELFQTEDSILAANNVINSLDQALAINDQARDGWGAEISANVGSNMPDWMPLVGGDDSDKQTLLLKNIVTEQALSQLRLVFGGNPTEGERNILLELQGSVNQKADVRKDIFDRAKKLALARLKFNEDRKAKIESGGYGTVNGGTRTGGAYTVIGVE